MNSCIIISILLFLVNRDFVQILMQQLYLILKILMIYLQFIITSVMNSCVLIFYFFLVSRDFLHLLVILFLILTFHKFLYFK